MFLASASFLNRYGIFTSYFLGLGRHNFSVSGRGILFILDFLRLLEFTDASDIKERMLSLVFGRRLAVLGRKKELPNAEPRVF